jgi:hypothetical protein
MSKMTVQEFATQLAADFAGECRAIVLYGSAAAGNEPAQGSDVNLLAIVKTLPPDALHRAAPTVRRWQELGHRAPLILTEAEWRSSRDVFAMEHADIAARHRVLHGALPALPAVATDDLRRQLEYETMGALLHLRRGVLAVGADPLRTLELLVAVKGTVFALLRSLLRVHGEAVPSDAAEVLRAAGARSGVDTAALAEVLAHSRGERSIPPARAAEVLGGVHLALKQLVAHVDAMVHPDAPAVD